MTQLKPQEPTHPERKGGSQLSPQKPEPPAFSSKKADDLMLEARAALDGKLNMADITAVRTRMQRATDEAKAWADHLAQRVLSPLLTRQEITKTRKEAESAEFDAQRLASALQLVSEAEDAEDEKERQAELAERFRKVMQERDKLASEISIVWPNITERVLVLCERIMRSNAQIEALNRDGLPAGEKPLETAEAKARGFHDENGVDVPSSLSSFRITQSIFPSLDPGKLAWPPIENYQVKVRQIGKVFEQRAVERMWRNSRALD